MHSAVLALLGPALLTAHLASAASASSFPFGETDGVPNIPDKANCGTSPNKQLNQTLNLGCWRPDAELIKTACKSFSCDASMNSKRAVAAFNNQGQFPAIPTGPKSDSNTLDNAVCVCSTIGGANATSPNPAAAPTASGAPVSVNATESNDPNNPSSDLAVGSGNSSAGADSGSSALGGQQQLGFGPTDTGTGTQGDGLDGVTAQGQGQSGADIGGTSGADNSNSLDGSSTDGSSSDFGSGGQSSDTSLDGSGGQGQSGSGAGSQGTGGSSSDFGSGAGSQGTGGSSSDFGSGGQSTDTSLNGSGGQGQSGSGSGNGRRRRIRRAF